jgi:uncharacterized protein (DUF4415 family)
MSKKTLERTWEDPADASPEAEVEEEFRFDPVRWEKLPKGVRKTRLSLDLDDDLVVWFKERAARPGAVPFQTQINLMLRTAMTTTLSQEVYAVLLKDETFIAAIAERVAEHTRTRKPKAGKQTRRAA